jgi:hypothetical protein
MKTPLNESAADIAAYAVRLGQLRSRTIEIVSKHPEFETRDFRRTVFVKICAVCDSAGIAYLFLGKCVMRPEWWHSANGLFTIPPITSDSAIIGHVESLFALIRCGLTHLIFSQVETTLRAFLRTLAPGAVNSGTVEFKNIYECSLLRINTGSPDNWADTFLAKTSLVTTPVIPVNRSIRLGTRPS